MTSLFTFCRPLPHHASRRAPWRNALAALACGMALMAPATAQDTPHERLMRLVQAGDLTQASQEVERQLAERPRDPQVRLVRGLIQSRQGRQDDAFATWTELTRDYHELPEPHNNLAVLHAGAGRLDQARASLETAVRLNPGYATAHHNLGDVYLQLAAQAYRTSLQLRPDAPALSNRLRQLEQLQTPR